MLYLGTTRALTCPRPRHSELFPFLVIISRNKILISLSWIEKLMAAGSEH